MYFYAYVQQELPCPLREAAWDIAILTSFPVWKCVLLPRTYTRHVVSTLSHCSPPFSRCPSLLISHPCPAALCLQPFTNGPDSIMWQLLFGLKYCQLPWLKAEGLSEPSQGYLETTRCFPVPCIETSAAAKNSSWMGRGGRCGLPTALLKISHPFPRQQVKDLVWRCHFYKWNTFYITSTRYGSSCKVVLREACSSRKPWTAGTLVLGLSQMMPSRSCGLLCKPVSLGSEPIQCISSESSGLFSDCICRSKALLSYPVNHPAMQTVTSKWESIYTKFATGYNVRTRLCTNILP